MATKISASQISGSASGSWYARLKALQSKFEESQTTATIAVGTKITASTMNTYIQRLNALKNNSYGYYANWTAYQPSTVTQGSKINMSNTYTKINNMLSSLESLCANNDTYYTDDTGACDTDITYSGDNECETDGTCETEGYSCDTYATSENGTCATDGTCSDYCGDNITDEIYDCENCYTNTDTGCDTNNTCLTDATCSEECDTCYTDSAHGVCDTDSTYSVRP